MGNWFKDFVTGDWGNAFNANELKPGGWIPNEINNPTGALTALAGGLLLGPAVGAVLAPLAGAAGSAVGGALGSAGLGGVSSALGSLAGSTLGSTAIGLGTGALASNALGGLLGGALGGANKTPAPQAIGAGIAPTYDKTLLDAFNAQLAIEPQKLAANQLYQPQWAKLSGDIQAELARRQLELQTELQSGASGLQAAYLNADRKNQLAQLQGTLPQYQQAIQGITPGYTQALQSTGQLAQNAMARAGVMPQLTAFEGQVGSPYGPAVQQQAQPSMGPAQMPPAQQQALQYQMAMQQAMQGQQSQIPFAAQQAQGQPQANNLVEMQDTTARYQQLAQQLQSFRAAGKADPPELVAAIRREEQGMSAPQGAQAPSAPTGAAATLPPPPGFVPMGPPLPPGIQGPQAPSQEYLDASLLKRQMATNQQAATNRLAAEQQTLSQLPALNQQQAWGQMPPSPQGPAPGQPLGQPSLRDVVAGQYAAAVPQFNAVSPLAQVGQTAAQAAQSAGMVPNAINMAMARSAESAARSAGMVPTAMNTRGIAGPRLQSGLENIDQGTVNQYVSTMPGMADYARKLSQISQQELAAGRGLTPEEERMAQQAARAGYAARGTALGGQSVAAEVLNRADVANQRFQQRMGTAAQAAAGIQGVYQPALAQSLQRQQGGLQYGLEAQGQAFGQARDKDLLAQQLQAQRYSQAMGTQAAGFSQAQAKDTMAQATQAQRYLQATGTQATGFGQALGQGNYLKDAQQQAYAQAMGREALASSTQGAAFQQALQRGTAEQQRLQAGTSIQAGQAQLGAGAMGIQQKAQSDLLNAYFQQPILSNAVNQAGTMGLANQAASGNTLFNPESPIAASFSMLPYQSNIAMQLAQTQANASKQASTNSMIGGIGGSLLGALPTLLPLLGVCWVAREVYGTKTGTWKVFRSWLLNEAPEWLVSAYIKHGPDIAQFIKDKPVLKSVIRRWMDSKIESYLTA